MLSIQLSAFGLFVVVHQLDSFGVCSKSGTDRGDGREARCRYLEEALKFARMAAQAPDPKLIASLRSRVMNIASWPTSAPQNSNSRRSIYRHYGLAIPENLTRQSGSADASSHENEDASVSFLTRLSRASNKRSP